MEMTKVQTKRILIPLTVQFSVRYVIRTGLIEKIKEYAEPVVLLGWDDNELTKELESKGILTLQMPFKS